MSSFKIHFIRCISIRNAGDMACGPYLYFKEFTKKFICTYHDMGMIDFNDIDEDDVVIIGASGLFEVSQEYVDNINLLFERCKTVIAWSVGHNNHYGVKLSGNIKYEKFALLTVRDYAYENQRYLPCVTCMIQELENIYKVKRKIGVIEHTNYPIREFKFDRISNSCAIENIIEFIGTSEVIITNSYHCAYWSMLMKKKVILYNTFSTKFEFLEHKVVMYSGKIEEDIEKCEIYPGYLNACRKANQDFFEEVMRLIEEKSKKANKINYDYEINKIIYQLIDEMKNKKIAVCGEWDHMLRWLPLIKDKIYVEFLTGEMWEPIKEFKYVEEKELYRQDIDIMMIVSFKKRELIKERLRKSCADIQFLDIYEYFERKGLFLQKEFYKYMSRVIL